MRKLEVKKEPKHITERKTHKQTNSNAHTHERENRQRKLDSEAIEIKCQM